MKFDKIADKLKKIGSPPSRGAWIEIAIVDGETLKPGVAPLAGGVD